MTNKSYRGYYIDGCTFNTNADIDAFIKAQYISRMQRFNAMMLNARNATTMMVASAAAQDAARFLHDQCDMSWGDIEAVEFA